MSNVRDRVSENEWQTRVELAALYRIVALYGWDDLVFTHLTARVPGEDAVLINPYGLMFDEVSASNLVKIDLAGNILLETDYQINPAGYMVHSAVHQARVDAHCVVHLHTRDSVAVSAQHSGLLPISQQASIVLRSLGYHNYEGIVLNPDERGRLQANLGDHRAMLLRNHGLLVLADNIPDAWIITYVLETACQIQIAAQSGNSKLVEIADEIVDNTDKTVRAVTQSLGGAVAWPGLIRKLDRLDRSYRK